MNARNDPIKWEYFKILHKLDSNQLGNARVCPRLTLRHVELDSTAKMRVRLATQVQMIRDSNNLCIRIINYDSGIDVFIIFYQIFSNSVANGLQFYVSQKCQELKGCEATIEFCKRMNDMFDALNRKVPNQGVTSNSYDFQVNVLSHHLM